MYADSAGNWKDHPVGTGPYRLRSWISKQGVVLERNPGFRIQGMPQIEELHFEILKEEAPRFVKFMRGDLDLLEVPNDNFASAMSDAKTLHPDLKKKGIGVSIEDTLIAYWVGFNVKDKTLSNKYLRQAISSAIDREKWLQLFEMGRGTLQTQMAPPGISDRAKNGQLKYGYDLARAKSLMVKAGHPNGVGLPILRFDFRGANEQFEKLGRFFEAQLKEIGIKIEVRLNTFPAYLEKAKNGNLQIFLDGWSLDYPDIENMLQLLYGGNLPPGSNRSNFKNAEYDRFYKKLTTMQPGPARQALVEKMEAIVQEEAPWAYGYYQRKYKLFQPWVKNFHSAELVPNTYKYLSVGPRP
jgi:oligopeptide transport system substrate-binding protein